MFQKTTLTNTVNASDGDRSSVVKQAWKNVLRSKGHTMMGAMAGYPLFIPQI